MDPLVFLLQAVTDYMEARLEAGGQPVRSATIVAGANVAWDDCCTDTSGDGQLRVRAVTTFPTDAFPYAKVTNTQCHDVTAVQVEASVVRCAATMDDRGTPPDEAALTAEATVVYRDRTLMRQALLCDLNIDEDAMVGEMTWEPLGPEGGCVGSRWLFTVSLDECYCPEV